MHMQHKYCPCGCPIRISYFWIGMKTIPVFRTEIDFEKITHCPECGEQLREETLNPITITLEELNIDL